MDLSGEDRIRADFAALEEQYAIGGRARQFIDDAVRYHRFPAPGVVLGAYMVDMALEHLNASPHDRLFAVAETPKCVSDSIGIITGCTPGSSKFLLFNTGRISIALGRDDGSGIARCVRVFVRHELTGTYPALHAWYMNDPGCKNNIIALLDDILRAGRTILGWEYVTVAIPPKEDKWSPVVCPVCGESLPDKMMVNGTCKACGQGSCYTRQDKK